MTARNAILITMGLATSGLAAAQDTTATKTSSMPSIIEKSYASLHLRHTTLVKVDPDGKSNVVPQLNVIPTLGSHLFNDKLDLAVSWYFRKNADSVRVNKIVTYGEATFTILEQEHAALSTYAYTEQADGPSFSIVDIGPHLDLMTSVPTPVGKLAFSGFVEPLAEFTSGKGAPKAGVRDRTESGRSEQALTGGEEAPPADAEIEQRDPLFTSTTEVAAKLALDAVKGLSIGVGVDHLKSWEPHYEATTEGSDVRYDLAGYKTREAMLNKFTVSYKLTDAVTLTNQVRYMVDGLYEDRYDTTKGVAGISARIENRLAVTATLF